MDFFWCYSVVDCFLFSKFDVFFHSLPILFIKEKQTVINPTFLFALTEFSFDMILLALTITR